MGRAAVCSAGFLGHDDNNAHDPTTGGPDAVRDWPFAVKSILGFWSFYALTVVARAFLGSDPWTMLENKLVVVGDRHPHHRHHLPRHQRSGQGASIRRKAIIAGIASAIASLAMGGALDRRSKT